MSHHANPPFNDSATALRACAFPRSGATMQLVSAAKDHFRKERAEQVNKRDDFTKCGHLACKVIAAIHALTNELYSAA